MLALKQHLEDIFTELSLNRKVTVSRSMFVMLMLYDTLCAGGYQGTAFMFH